MSDENIERTKGFFSRLSLGAKQVMTGEMLADFMGQHRKFTIYCVLMAMVYVLMGYVCNAQRAEIAQLEKDQKVAYYTNMTLETELTKVSRQSQLQAELQRRHSRIRECSVPAIRL